MLKKRLVNIRNKLFLNSIRSVVNREFKFLLKDLHLSLCSDLRLILKEQYNKNICNQQRIIDDVVCKTVSSENIKDFSRVGKLLNHLNQHLIQIFNVDELLKNISENKKLVLIITDDNSCNALFNTEKKICDDIVQSGKCPLIIKLGSSSDVCFGVPNVIVNDVNEIDVFVKNWNLFDFIILNSLNLISILPKFSEVLRPVLFLVEPTEIDFCKLHIEAFSDNNITLCVDSPYIYESLKVISPVDCDIRYLTDINELCNSLKQNAKFPQVSCILPLSDNYLLSKERIESVVNQTCSVLEVIIVGEYNNLAKNDACIKELRKKLSQNCVTISGNIWDAISVVKGDFIWVAEPEEYCADDFLENLLIGIIRTPSVGLAWSRTLRLNEGGYTVTDFSDYYKSFVLDYSKNCVRSGYSEIVNSFIIKNPVITKGAALLRTKLVKTFPKEFRKYKTVTDWFLYVWILRFSNMYYCADNLNLCRHVSESTDLHVEINKNPDFYSEKNFIQKYILNEFPITSAIAKQLPVVYKDLSHIKKRICVVSTNDYGWGGSEVNCVRLAEGFANFDGYSVLLVMRDTNKKTTMFENCLINGKSVFCGRVTQYYYEDNQYYQVIKDYKPNIIFISQGTIYEGEILMNWCQKEQIPYCNMIPLFTDWDVRDIRNAKLETRMQKALSKSLMIFSDNNQSYERFKEILGQEMPDFKNMPSPIDVDYNQKKNFPENEKEFSLAYLGRLVAYHKGLDTLVKVLEQKKWLERPLRFFFYGVGDYKNAIELSIRLHGTKITVVEGYSENIASDIQRHQGCVFASRMEGTPLTLVDSMLCYRMVIGTPVGGLPDYIIDRQTGFLAGGYSFEDIDEVLERAWANRDEWKNLGLAAGEFIRNKIPENAIEKYQDVFDELIDRFNEKGVRCE